MKKTMGRLIFGAVMLAAVFFMSAFLFTAGVQAVDVSSYDDLGSLLENEDAPETLEITITDEMDITDQIEVSSGIKKLTIDGDGNKLWAPRASGPLWPGCSRARSRWPGWLPSKGPGRKGRQVH